MPVVDVVIERHSLLKVKQPDGLPESQVGIAAEDYVHHPILVSVAVLRYNGQGIANYRSCHVRYINRLLFLSFRLY